MSLPAATGNDVRLELWSSFVSLLRSYAAVASLHGAKHGVLALGDGKLHVCASVYTLKLSYHATICKGSWVLARGTDRHSGAEQPKTVQHGDFDVNLDGSITLDGSSVEMDFAAIQLIAALTHAASRVEIEVPA